MSVSPLSFFLNQSTEEHQRRGKRRGRRRRRKNKKGQQSLPSVFQEEKTRILLMTTIPKHLLFLSVSLSFSLFLSALCSSNQSFLVARRERDGERFLPRLIFSLAFFFSPSSFLFTPFLSFLSWFVTLPFCLLLLVHFRPLCLSLLFPSHFASFRFPLSSCRFMLVFRSFYLSFSPSVFTFIGFHSLEEVLSLIFSFHKERSAGSPPREGREEGG